jgi:hypothetical protein
MIRPLLVLLAVWTLPIFFLGWLRGQSLLLIQRLTVDVAALTGAPPYLGLLSNFGVALWLITGWLLIFVGWTLAERPRDFFWIGVLSLWLGLDDGLMLHEAVIPGWLGISDRVVQPALYATYLAILWKGLRSHSMDRWSLILAASLSTLATSLLIDVLKESEWLDPRHPLHLQPAFAMWCEDGLKWLGILAWSAYWQIQAYRRLHSKLVKTGDFQ